MSKKSKKQEWKEYLSYVEQKGDRTFPIRWKMKWMPAIYGGGVYNSGECYNYICIKENMAQYGGGVYNDGTFYNEGDICLNSNFGSYKSGGGVHVTYEGKFYHY